MYVKEYIEQFVEFVITLNMSQTKQEQHDAIINRLKDELGDRYHLRHEHKKMFLEMPVLAVMFGKFPNVDNQHYKDMTTIRMAVNDNIHHDIMYKVYQFGRIWRYTLTNKSEVYRRRNKTKTEIYLPEYIPPDEFTEDDYGRVINALKYQKNE